MPLRRDSKEDRRLLDSLYEPADHGSMHRRRWLVIILLLMASITSCMDQAAISIALPTMTQELGLDRLAEYRIASAFQWSFCLMLIPMGVLSDRVSLRALFAVLFVLWSLACGLVGTATTLPMIMLFRTVLGFGEAVATPGSMKVVSRLFAPTQRGFPCAVFDSGRRFGIALEILVTPWVVREYGWRAMFYIIGFGTIPWVLPWLMVFPRTASSPGKQEKDIIAKTSWAEVALLLCDRNLLALCAGEIGSAYYWNMFVAPFPAYLSEHRGLSLDGARVLSVGVFISFGCSELLGGWFADRLVRGGHNETRVRRIIVSVPVLFSLAMLGCLALATTPSPIPLVLLLIAAGLPGAAAGNVLSMVHGTAPPQAVGLWTSCILLVQTASGLLCPLLIDELAKATGAAEAGFVLGVVLLALALLPYWCVMGELHGTVVSVIPNDQGTFSADDSVDEQGSLDLDLYQT